jgi:hypothetical protein
MSRPVENHGKIIPTGENRITQRNTCLGATLSTTSSTYTDLDMNSGLRGEGPANNHLNHDTANDATKTYTNFPRSVNNINIYFHEHNGILVGRGSDLFVVYLTMLLH